MPPLQALDELGIRSGTDKSSLQHDYLAKYERLFAPWRSEPVVVLEIGIWEGASLRMWEQYFERATIVGVDIQPRCREHAGGRRVVEIASQDDAPAMTALARAHQPTVVIDDGSHRADHILTSFRAIYPHLRAGGLYVVEDVGFHAGADAQRWRGTAPISPQDYFLSLARFACCNETSGELDPALAGATESVEFFHGAIVVRKQPQPDPDALQARLALAEELDSAFTWGWLSGYVARHGGTHEESIACARRAAELVPNHVSHLRPLYEALERAGRDAEALEAAEAAERAWPDAPPVVEAIKRLRAKVAGAS